MDRSLILKTTRSNASNDAFRDMDGFDVDEELSRLQRALVSPRTAERDEFLAEAISNIDEHLFRGGRLPRSWMGAKR